MTTFGEDLDAFLAQHESDAIDAATKPLEADLADARAALQESQVDVADRDNIIAGLNQRITALQADLDACRGGQPAPPEPQPEPAAKTLFGVSAPKPENVAAARANGYATFRRFYPAGLPKTWSADGVLALAQPGDTWILSHKTATDAQVHDFLTTVPKGVAVWMARHHEPENDLGKDWTAEKVSAFKTAYRAAQMSHAKAVQAAGHKAALILMGYTSEKGSGRDYRDWYAPEVDAIFWDAYNSGNKKTPPVFETPAHIIEGILAIAKATGKPWGVTETGAKVNVTPSNGFTSRAQWTAAFAKELKDNGALVATWWDQVNDTGTFDVRLDKDTAAAWR